MYHWDGPNITWVDYIKSWYEDYVFPKMDLSYQKAMTVPGSFGSEYNDECDMSCYDNQCNEDAINYYFWALEDERLIGLYPWHWQSKYPKQPPNNPNEIGTMNLTLTLQTWKEIGLSIRNQSALKL